MAYTNVSERKSPQVYHGWTKKFAFLKIFGWLRVTTGNQQKKPGFTKQCKNLAGLFLAKYMSSSTCHTANIIAIINIKFVLPKAFGDLHHSGFTASNGKS